jgi:hypothetical protein
MRVSATLYCALPKESYVCLSVYDLLDREVVRLAAGVQSAGVHETSWRPTAARASGPYLCRRETSIGTVEGRFVVTR